jgi:hypothetical protein
MTETTVKKKAVTKKKVPAKKAPAKKTATPVGKSTEDKPEPEILQTSKCKTVSGKSTLTYHVGTDPEDNIFIRVNHNTGGGYFSKEWISLDHITSVLNGVTDHPVTSIDLIPLFKGKTVNTPGYLLAVLLNESLLVSVEDKKRKYQFIGAEKFLLKVAKKAK